MIQSMTGYASKTRELANGSLSLELKSVNSRFLDIHFRIGDELRSAEPALREAIAARVGRGKVECRAYFMASARGAQQLAINAALLGQLGDLDAEVRRQLPEARPLAVGEVLRWPGIFGEETVDSEALLAAALATAQEVLADFSASRKREGEKLKDVIKERVDRMRVLVDQVAPHIPAAQAAFQEKLKQRLIDAIGSADDERVRQEVIVFAARIDVAEELARLVTHLDEVERVLKQGGAVGKRLDFLMQELNREANTLGSKSVVSEVSQTAMELKLLIEQMREQVQNLE
ncbi:MAG: YicC family protein [Rhodocyclaceae bacterium]|nr:YicC family protein [Rhodocyclaceae bacterium]